MSLSPPRTSPLPEGLLVELVTPLTAEGLLDVAGLNKLVDRVAPVADGILAGGPGAGEALDLPLKTRRELLSQALAAVDGRVPLFFGITGNSWEETQELAGAFQEECRSLRSPAFMVDLPLWYHSNRGLPQMCKVLLHDASLPLVLLNLPEVISRRGPRFKHRNIRTHVFKKLTGVPGIVGLIYQGEMRRYLNYHYAAAARPGFAFYEADEANFLTRPGAWGVLSAGAQLLPGAWQRATRACLHPEELADNHERRCQLWELSQRLLEIAKLCRPNPTALLKAALAAQGVLTTPATAPGTPPARPSQKEELLGLLAAFSDQS